MGMKVTDAMQRVAAVFYSDYYTKTEAAKEYANIGEDSVGHGSVRYYFKEFDKWFESGMIQKKKSNGSYSTWERSRLKPTIYFYIKNKRINKDIKKYLITFFDHPVIRAYIKSIPNAKLFDIFDQLLLYLIVARNEITTNPSSIKKGLAKMSKTKINWTKLNPDKILTENSEILKSADERAIGIYISLHSNYIRTRSDYHEICATFGKLSSLVKGLQMMQNSLQNSQPD